VIVTNKRLDGLTIGELAGLPAARGVFLRGLSRSAMPLPIAAATASAVTSSRWSDRRNEPRGPSPRLGSRTVSPMPPTWSSSVSAFCSAQSWASQRFASERWRSVSAKASACYSAAWCLAGFAPCGLSWGGSNSHAMAVRIAGADRLHSGGRFVSGHRLRPWRQGIRPQSGCRCRGRSAGRAVHHPGRWKAFLSHASRAISCATCIMHFCSAG